MNAQLPEREALTPTTGVYLRAIGQCLGLDQALVERQLPPDEREVFRRTLPLSKPIATSALSLDAHHHLALWHPQQIQTRLATLADNERRRCWSFFPDALAQSLRDESETPSLPAWPTTLSRAFFKRRCWHSLGLHTLRPFATLNGTPLDHLLELRAQDLSNLADLMALHTLFTPLKHMIERQKREGLKEAVKGAKNGRLLLAYMRHLQSDINEQTASITAIQFPLYRWDWQVATFEPLLHHFGLYCLAQMLKGFEESYLEHICLKLDLATSTQFRFLLKQAVKQRPNEAQIDQSLKRLAAKASDFLSSQHPPKRAQ